MLDGTAFQLFQRSLRRLWLSQVSQSKLSR